jgi:hypothetical protein
MFASPSDFCHEEFKIRLNLESGFYLSVENLPVSYLKTKMHETRIILPVLYVYEI